MRGAGVQGCRGAATALAVAVLLLLVPADAWACAVCNDPFDKNRIAFLATTAVLSALPLSLIGGLIAWLRKRAREQAPPDDAQS